tara:strand:- start:383 stop:700 length:318 start_codon:yes stop_codon:yes gene_type:complete
MVKKHMRSDDGMYHIKGNKYQLLIGSRAQVWHKTAYKTNGDLKREDLLMNKRGRVVSKKKFNIAKKEKRLEKAGYFTKKGKFGFVKHSRSKSRSHKSTKKHRKKH